MRVPPAFRFKGNRKRALQLKAQALQFYNFSVNQFELGGISFASKELPLDDGSLIHIVIKKEGIYKKITGVITIIGAGITTVTKVVPEYITVMSPTGTASGYPPTDPPGVYQSIANRLFYKTDMTIAGVDRSFFGSKEFPTISWTNKTSYNVACTRFTVYINGMYCSLRSTILSLLATNSWFDVSFLKAVVANNQLLLVIEWTKISPASSGRQLLRFDIVDLNVPGRDYFNLSYVPAPTDSTILASELRGQFESQFTSSSRSYITCYYNGTTRKQSIYRLVFNEGFTSFTKTLVYDRTVGYFNVYDAVVENIGEPYIMAMQAEGNNFGLVRSKIKTGTSFFSGSGTSIVNNYNIRWTFETCTIKADNSLDITPADSIEAYKILSDTGSILGPGGGGGEDFTASLYTENNYIYIIAFSAKSKSIGYEESNQTSTRTRNYWTGMNESVVTNAVVVEDTKFFNGSSSSLLYSSATGSTTSTNTIGVALHDATVAYLSQTTVTPFIQTVHNPTNDNSCRGVSGDEIMAVSAGYKSAVINLKDNTYKRIYTDRIDTFDFNPMIVSNFIFKIRP